MATAQAAPELAYHRPWLYPKQQEAIFSPARYAVVEASTKSGKTVGCLAWLLERALIHASPGQNVWWVAPWYSLANDAYRRMKHGLPRTLYSQNESNLTIELPNRVTMWFKSGEKPDALYGPDVAAAVVDEASRFREEAWWAIRTTLSATRGPVRIIGNVKGRKNWFYEMARKAQAGEPDMSYARLTWRDAVAAIRPDGSPILAVEEIEDARAKLPAKVFQELYEAEAADDEGNPFGDIRCCVGEMSLEAPAAWGWDLARSVDWTVGIALDAAGHVCRLHRWQRVPWEETHRRILEAVGDGLALVDSTGVGDAPFERLQRERGGHFRSYVFTSASKQHLMEGLTVAIHHREIRYPEGAITAELEVFGYEYTRTGVRYSAPEGAHDDCVVALALAVKMWRERAGWTLSIVGPEAHVEGEQQKREIERAKKAQAAKEVLEAILTQGAYFPGGR